MCDFISGNAVKETKGVTLPQGMLSRKLRVCDFNPWNAVRETKDV